MVNKIALTLLFTILYLICFSQLNLFDEFKYTYSLELANINKSKNVGELMSKIIKCDSSQLKINDDDTYTIILFAESVGFDTVKSIIKDDKLLSFRAVSIQFDKILNIDYYNDGGFAKFYQTYDLYDSTSKLIHLNYKGYFRDIRFDSNLGDCEEMRIDYSTSKKNCFVSIYRNCLLHETYSFDKKSGLVSFSIIEQSRGAYNSSKTNYILKKGKIIERIEFKN